ncbi:O-methyltransferase [Paraburkholderia caffeinilytica]|uniref:O-methyltransferase n=1 Tax=Paraburkholderia caffeinilytica TaxID=1761016 RepID=UPI0038B6C305
MSTLNDPTVSTLLDQLFAASDTTKAEFSRQFSSLNAAERNRLVADGSHRELYAYAKHAHLAVSRSTGKLLYGLARLMNARTIVEFGTSFGVSTLHLAAAVKDNGGGKVISTEAESSKVIRARENLAKAGLAQWVDILEGDALETLSLRAPSAIDALFLDGAKPLYPSVFALLEPHLRVGSLVIADNAEGSPEYLSQLRNDPRYCSVRIHEDVELSIKLEE